MLNLEKAKAKAAELPEGPEKNLVDALLREVVRLRSDDAQAALDRIDQLLRTSASSRYTRLEELLEIAWMYKDLSR